MTDARDIVTEAVPCNIVYGRPQAADDILQALTAAGYRIVGPDEVDPVTVVRPLDDWHEDYGDVVWWARLEGEWLGEAAWIGTPNDSDWPGYHTHWSRHPAFPSAIASGGRP